MAKLNFDDTIVALSTPPGEGGIAVIRLSGPEAVSIADRYFKSRSGKLLKDTEPQHVLFGKIIDSEGTPKDDVLVTYFKSPHSYTGEDIIEVSCHGGMKVTRALIELFVQGGARLAEPGEFTRRAFLKGRIDLVQAEAVLDLIKAKTDASLSEAERQLEGRLSQVLKDIRLQILNFQAEIEASIDFPEEDKEVYESPDLKKTLKTIRERVTALLETRNRGSLLRDGLTVAIAGKPNTGKSSLLNALLKRERAIVTDIPGTTRDTIEEWVEIDGFPVKLIDTAGIARTKDPVEKIGIERTRKALQEAGIVLVLLDGTGGFSLQDERILRAIPAKKEKLICITKKDLKQKIKLPKRLEKKYAGKIIYLSSRTGKGLEELERCIIGFLERGSLAKESVLITNIRHSEALHRALTSLKKCEEGLEAEKPLELIADDLKTALNAVGEIVGEVYTEDLLDVIFSRFCIGK